MVYSWRAIAFWLAALLLALLWKGPAFRPALGWQLPRADAPNFVPDFYQDWASARNLFEGRPIYAAHASTVEPYLGLRMDPADPVFIRENVHPPCSVLLALPLAFLDFTDAFALWNLLSLMCFGISIWLIVDGLRLPFSPWHLLPGCCLLLFCYPLLSQLHHGQLNLCLLLLVTLTWWADKNGNPTWAGILLGAATACKLFPGYLFLYFLVLGRWRTLVWGALAFAALNGAAVLILGVDAYKSYLFEVLPRVSKPHTYWYNLSLPGVWFKLFEEGQYMPPLTVRPLIADPRIAWAAALVTTGALTTAVAWLVTRLARLTVMGMVLAGPNTWDHSLLLLTLPLAILWPRLDAGGRELLALPLALLWLAPWWVVSHVLVLIQNDTSTAGPWATLVALSLPCWALVGVLVIAARVGLKTPAL